MWGPLIAVLLELFGPVLVELLKSLLDKWLKRAADQMPAAVVFGDDKAAKLALLDKTYDILPRFAFGRRALVLRMKAAVKRGGKPTPDDLAELQNALAAADSE